MTPAFASFTLPRALATLPKAVLYGVPAGLALIIGVVIYYAMRKSQAAAALPAGATYTPPPAPPAKKLMIIPIGGPPTGATLTALMKAANSWPACSPQRARLLAAAQQPPDVGC
jgi:hypothetical protein